MLWDDLQRLSRVINNTAAAHSALDRVQSLEQMRRLHDRWTEKALEDEKKEILASNAALIPFPTSPLGGNDQVVPIHNFRELYLESARRDFTALLGDRTERIQKFRILTRKR